MTHRAGTSGPGQGCIRRRPQAIRSSAGPRPPPPRQACRLASRQGQLEISQPQGGWSPAQSKTRPERTAENKPVFPCRSATKPFSISPTQPLRSWLISAAASRLGAAAGAISCLSESNRRRREVAAELRAAALNLLHHRAGSRVLRAIDGQNVFRQHIGLEQVGRTKNVTAARPNQFAVASRLGRRRVRRAVWRPDRDNWKLASHKVAGLPPNPKPVLKGRRKINPFSLVAPRRNPFQYHQPSHFVAG